MEDHHKDKKMMFISNVFLTTFAIVASAQQSPTSVPTSLPTGVPSSMPSRVPTNIPTFMSTEALPTPGTVILGAIRFNVSQTLCNVDISMLVLHQNVTVPLIIEAFGDAMNIPVHSFQSLNGYYTTCDEEDNRRRLQTNSTDADDYDDDGSGASGIALEVEVLVNEEDVSDQNYNSPQEAFNGILANFNASSFDDIIVSLSENSTTLEYIFENVTDGDKSSSDTYLLTQVSYTYTASPTQFPTQQSPTNAPTTTQSLFPTSLPTGVPSSMPSRVPTNIPTFMSTEALPTIPPTPGTVILGAIRFNVSQTLCNVDISMLALHQNVTVPLIIEAFGDAMNIPVHSFQSLNGYYTTCDEEDNRRRLQTNSTDADDYDDDGSGASGIALEVEVLVNEEDVSDQNYNSPQEAFNGILANFNASSFDDIIVSLSENSTTLEYIFENVTDGDKSSSDTYLLTQVSYTYTASPTQFPTQQSPTNAPTISPSQLPTQSLTNASNNNNNSSDKDNVDNSLFALFALLALPIIGYIIYSVRSRENDDDYDDNDEDDRAQSQSTSSHIPQPRSTV